MYCTRCGAQNADELMFCTSCSAPLVKPGEAQRAPRPYDYGQPGQQSPPASQSPYPGYQSSVSGAPGYQPYPSSYSGQMPQVQVGASGRAIASLILSIISIFTCGPFLSVPGLILGKLELSDIRQGKSSAAGEMYAKIGFYLGIIVTVFSCLAGLLWAAMVGLGAIS